jgi:hypothetical protein
MEMAPVWEESRKQKNLSLSFHTALESSQKPRASHIPTASATAWDFLFSPSSFTFNFDEKCYLHARYLLLPTCPFVPFQLWTALAAEVRFSIRRGGVIPLGSNDWKSPELRNQRRLSGRFESYPLVPG